MSKRTVHFDPKEAALRADVRRLGALVGDVIREQGGARLFGAVEAARIAAIRRREGAQRAEAGLRRAVASLPAADAEELVRAFSTYFQVVNLVERVHRIRRRRDHLRADTTPQRGSLEETLRRLRKAGWGPARVRTLLDRLVVEPVFTAHPTEATRRAILEKQQRIARSLVDRLDPSRTVPEERASLGRIRAEITTAWQTEEHPAQRPTVADELEHVLFYLADIVYRVIPPFYEDLEEGLLRVYGAAARAIQVPIVLRFASWVGGDMDGNPNVSARTMVATLARQRTLILERYRQEVLKLSRELTQSPSRVAVDREVAKRSKRHAVLLPRVLAGLPARQRDMPYAVFLRQMAARLQETGRNRPRGYTGPGEFIDDLSLIARSLSANRGAAAGAFGVRRALRRAATFGFHLATLDVRQDALVHRRVVGRDLGDPGWAGRPAAERTARLRCALRMGTKSRAASDLEARRTLEVMRAIAECRAQFGPHAIGTYIVSMTQGIDDVLSVLLLGRWAGLAKRGGAVPLDVAPLFETLADLEAAPGILEELFSDPLYRAHLAARGNRQTVMIGYSDSNKDSGLAASRWALQQAQAAFVRVARAAGIDITIFHGRGGTISRGGGKTHRAVLAAPHGAVNGRLRMTEQGEMINAKYGLRGIASRTLEQTVSAVLLATAGARSDAPPGPAWRAVMETIAGESRRAYRDLVYGERDFTGYFRHATPIDVIERMPIGSRPASRRSGGGVEALRAIPWVFAWTQSRHLLPGWYGLGAGLEAAVRRHGASLPAEMVRRWPFLRTLVDDAEMVLAKADMPVAAGYARLAPGGGRRVFALIRREFDRTVRLVLRLKGTRALLDGDRTLQRSIRLRNPYVDPMSLLQIDLLRRWRRSGRREGPVFRALLATVNGIAQGLQNTG